MRKGILIVLLVLVSFCAGRWHNDNYIDMSTIVDFDASETGLMLYDVNGEGYYWER